MSEHLPPCQFPDHPCRCSQILRKRFLDERRKGIGGSDVAAILGMSPWTTALEVYEDKLGLSEDKPPTFAMRRGTRIESAILDEFAEDHRADVSCRGLSLIHHEHEWMRANIDGVVEFDDSRGPEGVEAKSVGSFAYRDDDWGEEASDEIPDHYLLQVHWYLAVTGWKRWHLTVWFGLNDKRDFVIERDEDIVRDLIEKCGEFWRENVLAECPPDPATLSDAKRCFPNSIEGSRIDLDEATQFHVGCVAEYQAVAKRCEAGIDEHKLALQTVMGEAETIMDDDVKVVTWKGQSSWRFNVKRFQEEGDPETVAMFTEDCPSRPFRITANGKKLVARKEPYVMTAVEHAESQANIDSAMEDRGE